MKRAIAIAAFFVTAAAFADDAFTLKEPFIGRAVVSCGDLTHSDGTVDSMGVVSPGTTNRGHVASNGNVKMSGGALVDGDATAGPGKAVTNSGSSRVTGTKSSASAAFDCRPVDLAPLATSLQAGNDNGRIPLTGDGKNPLTGSAHTEFSMSGGDTITLPAGTYYFTKFTMSGGSTMTITGPVRILCTGNVSISGGSINNAATGGALKPYLLRLFSSGSSFTLSSSTMAGFIYAPSGSYTNSSAHLVGGVFANAVTISGGSSHVTRAIDDAAPRVTITAPSEGAIVSDPAHVEVRGTVSDAETAVVLRVNGQSVAVAADGTFQTSVNLTGVSPATIVAVATDAAGNTAEARVTVSTTPPPTLSLTSPSPGSYVNTRIVNLAGGSGAAASVTVNGQPATVANGAWTLTGFDLGADGSHTLTIVGTNAGGSSTITPTIISDTVAPTIQATVTPAPNAAGWNKTDVVVHFVCSDLGSGIATCPADVAVTTEGANQPVTPSAVDRAGNSTPATAVVSIDKTPPAVEVTSPQNNATVADPHLVLSGTTGGAVSVTVNGVAATIDADAQTFTTAVDLLEGRNDLAIAATDPAGNTRAVTLTVNLDTRAPELTITAPAPNACIYTDSLTVTGRVSDPNIDRVTVAGTAANLVAGTFTATIPLTAEGPLVIKVEARDGVQHLTTANVPVTVDRTKPVVAVTLNGAPFTGGAFNRAVTPSVRVTDADPSTVLTVTLDGAAYLSGTTVGAPGAHTLRASARDCAGNASDEVNVTFTIDTTAPHIAAFDPANGATIGAPRAFGGTVDADDLESATIEGTAFTATISGRAFSFDLPLAEGVNAFVVVLADRAGNVTRESYTLKLKSTAPSVEILESGASIAPGTLFNRAVTPVIRANEAGATVAATLNGATYVPGTAISNDGDYTLSATATDALGHTSAPAVATFTVDRTPPAVTIAAVVSGDHANVTGTVTGGDVTRVSINDVVAAVSGGSYSAVVALEIGANTLVAVAVDRAGNAASASIDVTRGDDRPGLVLTSPENNTITNRPKTIVAGQLLTLGGGARVTINGAEVPVDVNGTFRRTDFQLVEGDNAITAAIVGTTRAVTVHVIADFTPPALKVLGNGSAITSGKRFETSPQVTLQVSESATTRLSIDGNAIAGATPPLADGGHALTATARDAAGNETRVDVTFFVGAAATAAGCALSNFNPPNNSAIFSDTVTISGLSGGASNVTVNGNPAQVGDGGFIASVALPQEGANTITIACSGATSTLTLYRYTNAPSITIDPITPAASVTVTGTVGEGVTSGDVNGIAFTPAAGRYSVPNVSLNKGLNVVTARAKNGAGRIGIATARVTLPGTTPQIIITSPLPSAHTGAAAVDVTGTYADADPSRITVTAAGSTYTATTRPLGDTTGTFTVPAVALAANATTTITATAFSATNVQAQASVALQQVAGAPSIAIDAPLDNAVVASDRQSVDVSGIISAVAGSIVQINGVQAAVDASFHFTANVPLNAAVTPLVARVSTPDGKSASDSVRVIRLATPLTVTAAFPAANATGVDLGAVLVVLFSNPIDAATAHNGAVSLTDDAQQTITGTTWVDEESVSFAPAVALAPGKRYTLTVSQALKDLAGGALAAPYTLAFTTAAGAPAVAPIVNETDKSGCLSRETITGRASTGSAKVRLDIDGVSTSTVAAGDGTFRFDFSLSGQQGYHVARVREIGADGSLSPERTISYRINCSAPVVVGATLDRAAKTLSIQFSKPMDAATLVASPSGTILLGALTGTVALNASVATVAYTADLSSGAWTLIIKKEVKDAAGTPMPADFTQTFTLDSGPPRETGNGYVAGAVYDESTGRPLAGAVILSREDGEGSPTDEHGRYVFSLPEGAYTIRASKVGYTTVWRQVVVPAGAGVVPIDIRLTRRGTSNPSGGALALTHGSVDLDVPSAALAAGHTVTLTTVGGQSLAGLLPLGWSPLAAAEIVVDAPIPGSTLTFRLSDAEAAAVAAANQTLAVVRYDSARDEWRVLTAVATTEGKRVTTAIGEPGNYALVYPDAAAHLAHPPAPRTGAALAGVANPCAASVDACAMTKRSFTFDPPQVAPTQNALATLITDGIARAFPSGTAVQAYIDEQLNLSDGRVLFDPPFATDLLIYRNLAGNDGVATFHVAPTSRAAQETLRDGVDHVRVVDYPGRVDRGTLVGAQGGRVPGDDTMSLDLPSGATLLELHATMTPMSAADLGAFTIAGFQVAGGFTLTLTRSDNAAPAPADVSPLTVALLKPARGTFTVNTDRQVIVAEVLGSTVRLAATTSAAGNGVFVTNAIDPAQLPVDGILRDGRYLILTADAPIAFAWGLVRIGATGPILANARVTAPPLGVADLTRISGLFAIPVPAKPAAPFTLRAATLAAGESSPVTSATSPDSGQNVRLDIAFDAAPPRLTGVTPSGEVDTAQPLLVRATFDRDIDRNSVAGGIVVSGLTGTVDAVAKVVTFTPSQPLQPGTTYTITIKPTIRALNGAPFGQTATAQFRTRAIPSTAQVDASKIQITLPENGVSIIRGTAGALPPGANALAVRRGRNFFTQYQGSAAADRSFSFTAGSSTGSDRVTTSDVIDLQVIDGVSHAIIAIVPLTPFVTKENDGYLAAADRTTSFTTATGIGITVPAGAFDEPTIVRANPAPRSAFDAVTTFDEELHFSGGVRVDFDGIAAKRVDLDIPIAATLDPAKSYYLARLIDTVRGPRIELDDTLRIDGTKLSTTLPPHAASLRAPRAMAIPGVTTAGEVKEAMLGVVQRGDYGTVDVKAPIGWMYTTGLEDSLDLFINNFKSVAISGFWLSQKSGKVLMPVVAGQPFVLTGVDQATGVSVFTKPYSVQVPVGDPLSGVVVPAPTSPKHGPYPTFAALGRVELIDVAAQSFTDESRAGLVISFDGNQLTVSPSANSAAVNQPIELLNVTTGAFQQSASFGAPIAIAARKGERVLILGSQVDVDPLSNISFAFSEPITVPADLSTLFEIRHADTKQDVTSQAKFSADSGGRRVTIDFPVGLQRGKRYRVTLKAAITGVAAGPSGSSLGLGQIDDDVANLRVPPRDLHLEFTTRGPGGTIGTFNLVNPYDPAASGTARDLALEGNLLFVAGTGAGLLAYDVSNPADLADPAKSKPFAWAPLNPAFSETWSVAADNHGRIWTTGMTAAFGFLRAYTTDSFIDAPAGKDPALCSASRPDQCPEAPLRAAMIVSYRPGYLEALPLSTYDSGITTTLTTKPEAIPRKMRIVAQDENTSYTTADLVAKSGVAPVPIAGTDLLDIKASVVLPHGSRYWVQRVTLRNVTLGLQWSKDVVNNETPTTFDVVGRATDEWVQSINLTTYGIVNLFGFGLGIYDLNALDSNRWTTPKADPKVYTPVLEQVLISDATVQADCVPPLDKFPTFECDATELAHEGKHCPIPDLALSPESIALPAAGSQVMVYGLHAYRGLVDFKITGPGECAKREDSLTLAASVPWPTKESNLKPFDHPRLNTLRALFLDPKRNPAGRKPFARFSSIALYVRSTPAPADAAPGTPATSTNYALIAGADYGLLVAKLDPQGQLKDDALVDVVWIPSGAYSVRVVAGAQVATVTDGAGRVLLVDLTAIDESSSVAAISCSSLDNCNSELFPSARKAIESEGAPGEIGADDARIVWKSKADPGDLLRTTLAPIIDGETGILYKGDYLDPKVQIVAATDPRIRFLANLGDSKGLTEVSGITPMGIEPQAGLFKCTPGPSCDASAAAFRLDLALPGAVARSLPGNELRLALESETFAGVTANQTVQGMPRAHLRAATESGVADRRAATGFVLRRIIPDSSAPQIQRLKYQKAYNHFQSPWIVAVADPRASIKYVWGSADKSTKGCFACDRPLSLALKKEPDLFEIYSAGRYLRVRPEYTGSRLSVFSGTPYEYLGQKGRLERRLPTVMADTIHPLDLAVAAQNPPVAGGAIQETVYLHSGEVETAAIDLDAGGRAGFNVLVGRSYRSRVIGGSPLGFGWDSPLFARLRPLPNGTIEYRDGSGEAWTFRKAGGLHYIADGGLLAKLVPSERGFSLFFQDGSSLFFDDLGRLIAAADHLADPLRVVTGGKEEGNITRFFYDEKGRLSRVSDAVGRLTALTYYADDDAKAPGLLKEVKDWRSRTITYEYDAFQRLERSRLAEAGNPLSSYAHTGNNRPFIKYGYSSINAFPSEADTGSQSYNDFLELAPNLEAITDPAENAASTQTARVQFTYAGGTDAAQRDKVSQETWPCADARNAACSPRSASFTFSSASATVTDVLGQVRQYDLMREPDGRDHVFSLTERDVPVVTAASGALPSTVSPTLDPQSQTQAIVTTYSYDGSGQLTFLQGSDYTETNVWKAINPIIFGNVLTSQTAGSESAMVTTNFTYDTVAREPELLSIEKGGVTRAMATPHRDRHVTQVTEDNPADHQTITTATRYDDAGLVRQQRTYPANVTVPQNPAASDSLPAGATREEDRTVNAATHPQPHARGRYRAVQTPGSMNLEISYAAGPSGGEIQTIVDNGRQPAVTTKVTRDSMDRVIEIATSGQAPDVHEQFGYDAGGRLRYHLRAQKGLGDVVEKFTWDPLGRQLSISVDHASVAGVAGQEVETTSEYDLTHRTVTTNHAPNLAGVRAQTITTLDRLGRTIRVETTAPNTPRTTTVLGYDLHGFPAYQSDGALMAVLTQHDALGRETGSVTSSGVQRIVQTTPWGEVTDERTRLGGVMLSHAQHLYAPQGTPVNTAIDVGTAASGAPSLLSRFNLWDSGGQNASVLVGGADTPDTPPHQFTGLPVRKTTTTYDTAGRTIAQRAASFRETSVAAFNGALPASIVDKTPLRNGATFTTNIAYDALGTATTIDAPGGYTTSAESDQLGNRLAVTPPGRPQETASFDSRGLMVSRTVPDPLGPRTIVYQYDAAGGLTKIIDESGTNETLYDRDALGRVTKISYPDQTSEEVEYQEQTGLVKARRDRAGQWLSYRYDAGGRVTAVHKGRDATGPMVVRYDYSATTYRLSRVANVSAACEYDDYDLMGRPRITRSVRYAPGGNLADPATLVPTDVHVQQHVWSVFGDERTRWRMPAARAIPSSDVPSVWRSWIEETRDAGGNLIKLTATDSASGSSASDFVIYTATAAGIGELATRTLRATNGTEVGTVYRYHDAPLTLPAELGGGGALPQQNPTSALQAALVTRNGTPVAGTEVYRSANAGIGAQRELGLGDRGSLFQYDSRGRLRNSSLGISTASGPEWAPGTTEVLSESDFRKRREMTPAFSASQHALLGPAALTIEPPSWTATENPAHQIDQRQLLLDGNVASTRQYAFADGRRQSDGIWSASYDEFGRLTQLQSATRRIVAAYDPMGRIVGRSAYRLDGTAWILEDRADVLNADGLPAETTFVWDPITDRLVEIATAGASTRSDAAADAGLLRQYVHGDQGYDDPVEVLAFDRATSTLKRYLPIRDEAGTGSLQAVLDGADGTLVERVLYGDAYGDAPRYLQGPVVDKITADVVKDGAGTVEKLEFHVHLTDRVAPSSVAAGVTLQAAGATVGTSSVDSTDPYTVTVTLTGAQWQAVRNSPDATSVRLAVTSALRAEAWGETPVTPAPAWAVTLYGVSTSTALPVSVRESTASLAGFASGAPAGQMTSYPTIYVLPNLYLAGVEQSKTKLFTGFQALPFVEPATGKVYARARWFDPQTGSFLSADPIGYRDSSNLYAYCGGDPVNCKDPTGTRAMTEQDKARLAVLKARGKRLHDEFTAKGRADFQQHLLVPVEHPWWDPTGPIGGDYRQQLVASTVTTEESYERARQSMVNDVATFEAAVARADANGEIYYVAGQGFTTITAADRRAADRSTMVAAGIFFATDTVPMILSPYGMRGQVIAPAELPKEYHQDILVLGRYPQYRDLADELGAHRFDLRKEVWDRMSEPERQAANFRTLDRAIARRARVVLTDPVTKTTPGRQLEEELIHLYLNGYRPNAAGTELLPPPVDVCVACDLNPPPKR